MRSLQRNLVFAIHLLLVLLFLTIAVTFVGYFACHFEN